MLNFLHCKKAMNNNAIYIVMPSFAKVPLIHWHPQLPLHLRHFCQAGAVRL